MNVTINLDGVQEGRTYFIEFTINEGDGTRILKTSPDSPKTTGKRKKKDEGPSLDDFEPKDDTPTIGEPKPKTKPQDIKIESSFDGGRIDPNG